MDTAVRKTADDEDGWGRSQTHPFVVAIDDTDAAHGHDADGHTFPATRAQLIVLRGQIDEALEAP